MVYGLWIFHPPSTINHQPSLWNFELISIYKRKNMGRAKLPRKSTNIDMTAMCDVAFLLLSFFILATKFKPPEALSVITPSSVSTKTAPEKDVVLVTIDKDGKVYLSVSDANVRLRRKT